MRSTLFFAVALVACAGGSSDEETVTDDITDSGDTSTDQVEDTGPQLPQSPAPFTVEVSGGWTSSVTFDTPTCVNYPEGSLVNFRQFWRGSHNGLLIIEVLSNFTGAGEYNTTDHNLRMALQNEAGAEYNMSLRIDTSQGDSGTLTVDHVSDIAWGEATVTGMHGTVDGDTTNPVAVTLTSPLPIYCPAVTSQ
ncbi:MAG: hypothetical protein EP330_24955 [Deltaproteobacteria bacterium]|nr:MAG: hypothetical protein EP330_24955 [Deltaproteobacteria bacterium]